MAGARWCDRSQRFSVVSGPRGDVPAEQVMPLERVVLRPSLKQELPFAPKSSRIARWLLLHPDEFHVQKEIAAAIDVGAGFVSRVVMMRRGLWRFARTLLWRRWLLVAAGAAIVLFLTIYVVMKLTPPPDPAPRLPFPPAP